MVPLPVTLRWAAPAQPALYGAAFHYGVEVFEGNDFETARLAFDPVAQPELRLGEGQLAYSQCYHWRVRVVSTDAAAEEPASLWSRLGTVCFDEYPAPAQRSPRDGEIIWTTRPSVLWQPLSPEDLPAPFGVLPTHYDVQVGRTADLDDPANVVFEGFVIVPEPETPPATLSYFLPGELAADTDYWWRVRARHGGDGLGRWSAPPWRFHTLPVVGAPPELVSPADGASGVALEPLLRWQAAPGAMRHVVYVFDGQGSVVWQYDLSTPGQTGVIEQQVSEPLDYETAYTWQVQGYTATSSAWSAVWGFVTEAEGLPEAPRLQAPLSGSVGLEAPVELRWSSVSGSVGYRVQVAQDTTALETGPYVVDASGVEALSYELGSLASGERYAWRVCAENTSGHCGAWSAAWWFATAGPVSLPAPELLLPDPADATPVSRQPEFVWTSVSGASHYAWELSVGSDLGDPVATCVLRGTHYVHEHTLLPDQVYSWRVRGLDALGRTGPWSQTGTFVTQPEGGPPAPQLVRPADGTSGHPASVVLRWVPVTGALYHVQVAQDAAEFTAPLVDEAGLDEVHYAVGGLTEGRWYYWRVRACVEGSCSGWSSVWRWRVGEVGPEPGEGVRRYYYVRDHLGSVRATVDEAGAVVHHDDYYAFGARMPGRSYIAGEPTKENFTGHERDEETGLLYAGARYLDPTIGRWLSVEPLLNEVPPNKLLEIRGGQLLATSPYNYTFNNPVNLTDPDGKCPDCVLDAIAVGLSAKDFYDNPTWGNAGWLLADVAGAALPFVPSTGVFRHGAKLLTQGGRITDAGRMLSARRAIGMTADAASAAVENVGRVDHASRHLIDAGIMKGVNKGSKEARNVFRQMATGILEQPSATFNHTLRGGLDVKGFLGTVDGEQVVIFVAKQGQGKVRQGDVVTAIKPTQRQLDEWLNQ